MLGDHAILVLGGNRFVGRRLVDWLRTKHVPVKVFHRSPSDRRDIQVVRGNRECIDDLALAFADDPSIVIDLSLYTATQARLIVPMVRERGCRYIAVSSAVVYSQRRQAPWSEGDPVGSAPIWGRYGRGKTGADQVVREAELSRALILRPTYFIGGDDPARRCASLFTRAAAGEELLVPGDGGAVIQVLDADDMTAVLVEAIEREIVGVVNVAGSEPISVKAFTELCARRVSDDSRIRCVGDVICDELDGERWPFPNEALEVSDARFRQLFRHRCRGADVAVHYAYLSWLKARLAV